MLSGSHDLPTQGVETSQSWEDIPFPVLGRLTSQVREELLPNFMKWRCVLPAISVV